MPLLGPSFPFPSSSGWHPSASLPPTGDGPVHSRLALLWYLLSPLFCERAWQCLRLELFTESSLSLSLFFPSLSLAIPQFGFLSHVSFLILFSGHSGWVLTLSNAARASLFSPHSLLAGSLLADLSIWATSPLVVAVRHVICGFFFFFLLVMLPSEIPKLCTDPLVRGFPGVRKLLLLHDSFPRMGLHP